jgi:fructokinase
MAAAILVGGEALVDFLPIESAAGRAYRAANGGSPRNVALGLARLGAPVGFFGAVSTDSFGAGIVAELEENGVDTNHVARLDRPTTLAFAALGRGEPAYAFYDAEAADRHWRIDDLPKLADSAKALHFGSISLVRLPAANSFAELLEREAPRRLISFDPNIRATAMRDEKGYRGRLDRFFELADVIKASAADLAWIAPGRDPADLAAEWLAKNARLVFLTGGAAGATLHSRSGAIERPAPPVDVVDTIGAGDSFVAGCLAALYEVSALSPAAIDALEPPALEKILDQALAAAALTCGRAGADPPRRAELRAHLSRA